MIIKKDKLIKVEVSDVKDGVLTIPNGVKKIKDTAFADVMIQIVWNEEKEQFVRTQDVKIKKLVLPRSLTVRSAESINLSLLNAEDIVIADKQDELTM